MTDPREWIAQAKARCDAATESPWRVADADQVSWAWRNPSVIRGDAEAVDEDDWIAEAGPVSLNGQADAEFIAHARTDLPRALAALTVALDQHEPAPIFKISTGFLWACSCGENLAATPRLDVLPGPCSRYRAITAALGGAS